MWYINFYLKGKIHFQKQYFPNGRIKAYGDLFNENISIGKWKYFNEDGTLCEIREMKYIQGKSYLNQNWFFNDQGDTLKEKGSFYDLRFLTDTIFLNEPIEGIVDLINPIHKKRKSSIMVVVPRDYSVNFNHDFSNIKQVDTDTTYNLNIEKDYKRQAGLKGNYERSVIFGRYYNKPGLKKFRGIIIEYSDSAEVTKNSLNYFEHKKYFEKEIYVKENIH